MLENTENVIENINFSMSMEGMPLTEEDRTRLKNCLAGQVSIREVLQETIQRHTLAEA